MANASIEKVKTRPKRIPHWKIIIDQGVLTPEIIDRQYHGQGTTEDPYVVRWIENDPRNPYTARRVDKWMYAFTMAFTTLALSLVSSAYASGIGGVMKDLHCSQEVATLGLSIYVLGFAIGPLIWAPLSEMYGRQKLFFFTFGTFVAFSCGSAGSGNSWTLIIIRGLAGSFGASPLTNAGGVVADLFPPEERGLALGIFSAAPFMGPILGPIIGGFIAETIGWRWILGITSAFAGVLWIIAFLIVPETYAPVLLAKRAKKLSTLTGKVYRSKIDVERGPVKLKETLTVALSRPWIMLFKEPIVTILSIYISIVYGTLYLLFGAFPVVYEQSRGWNAGISGLAFIGVGVGMMCAIVYLIFYENNRYIAVMKKHGGHAPPEARLPPAIVGSVALPIGLFWFAWTNYPSVHWIVSILAGAPFGFGMVLTFLGVSNYLVDSYTIFAASVLAAKSLLRSIFGAVFPLFTIQMYHNLGIHWASTIPAFLALACMPFPYFFMKYGHQVRQRCTYTALAEAHLLKAREEHMEELQNSSGQKVEAERSDAEMESVKIKEGASDDEVV